MVPYASGPAPTYTDLSLAYKVTLRHELAVIAVVPVIGGIAPDHRFTSFTVTCNAGSKPHEDSYNRVGSCNLLLAVSGFSAGERFGSRMPRDLFVSNWMDLRVHCILYLSLEFPLMINIPSMF